jgi:hypothetical protein
MIIEAPTAADALRAKRRPVGAATTSTSKPASVPVPGEYLDAPTGPADGAPKTNADGGLTMRTTPAPVLTDAPEIPKASAPAKAATAQVTPLAGGVLPSSAEQFSPTGPPAPTAIPDGSGGAIPVPPLPAKTANPAVTPVSGGILTSSAEQFTPTAAPVASPSASPVTALPDAVLTSSADQFTPPAPAVTPVSNGILTEQIGELAGAAPSASPSPLPDTFTADENLINSQVGPAASRRALDLQAAQDAQLAKITDGPDRFAIAKEQYDAFTRQAESDYRRARIDETNRAAEGGYLGAGRLTNAYGDVEERRHLADLNARTAFLTPALAGTIADNQNALSAARGLTNDAYGQEASQRDEVRAERDYQRGLAEQAIARRIQQQAAEAGLTQQEFENAMRQYQLGNANSPVGTYENAATNASQEASGAGDDVAALLRAFAARRATGG